MDCSTSTSKGMNKSLYLHSTGFKTFMMSLSWAVVIAIPMRWRRKHSGEIVFIGELSAKLLCGRMNQGRNVDDNTLALRDGTGIFRYLRALFSDFAEFFNQFNYSNMVLPETRTKWRWRKASFFQNKKPLEVSTITILFVKMYLNFILWPSLFHVDNQVFLVTSHSVLKYSL